MSEPPLAQKSEGLLNGKSQPTDRMALGVYVAPLAALLLTGSLFPFPEYDSDTVLPAVQQQRMVWLLIAQCTIVLAAIAWWFFKFGQNFSWRVSRFAIGLGFAGVVLWIFWAAIDRWLVSQIGLAWLVPQRESLNPWQQLPDAQWRNVFLFFRFLKLAVLVPVAEEVFARGWLGRWFESESQWEKLPLKNIGRDGLIAIAAYAVLAHPMEALAATVWFNMVSWHMKRTGSLMDCIVIHATTNFLLGLWVISSGNWQLW